MQRRQLFQMFNAHFAVHGGRAEQDQPFQCQQFYTSTFPISRLQWFNISTPDYAPRNSWTQTTRNSWTYARVFTGPHPAIRYPVLSCMAEMLSNFSLHRISNLFYCVNRVLKIGTADSCFASPHYQCVCVTDIQDHSFHCQQFYFTIWVRCRARWGV